MSTITSSCWASARCSLTGCICAIRSANAWRETGSAIAFCPTSNFFLGSGLFNLPMAERHKVNVGLGTDVGGGTSFSILQTLNEAYKVMQLQGAKLSPFKSLYLATLGGARALRLEDKIGNLQPKAPKRTSWCWISTPRRCCPIA
jgi:cytosine/adenosine deaminase-related metal-dependent hydrolase